MGDSYLDSTDQDRIYGGIACRSPTGCGMEVSGDAFGGIPCQSS